jgi:hypothetical protein
MKQLQISRSLLRTAVEDPKARLVEILGDQLGTALFGAVGGSSPAGLLTLDTAIESVPGQRGLTVDGQDINTIWTNMQNQLAAFNISNDAVVALFSFDTVKPNEKVGIPINPGFQKATELGRPSKVRLKFVARGFPLEHFDLGDGYTQEFIDIATGAELVAVQATILNSWTELQKEITLDAVMGSTNYTDKDGINVKRLYNNDGEIPPTIKRWTHDGTHQHYLFGGGGGFVQADLDVMSEHLVHHGFREFGESTFILLAHRDEIQVIRGFANFITSEESEQPENIATSGVIKGLQRRGGTDGLRVEGFINDWTVVQYNDMVQGYLVGMISGGPFDVRNVVGQRLHENPSVRGLRLIEGRRFNYPIYDSVYDGYAGAGVGQRGAAVVMQDAASYTAPTFNVGE